MAKKNQAEEANEQTRDFAGGTPETTTHEEQMANLSAAAELEAAKAEPAPQVTVKVKKVLVTGAEYWPFKEPGHEEFIGTYVSDFHREKDGDMTRNQKAGDIIGHNFVDENGEMWIISNSHSVTKAISQINVGDKLLIRFKGQVQNAKGEDVNQFYIALID